MNRSVPVAASKCGRPHVPEVPRIERPALKVQHAVVFGDQVQVASRARNARKLGDHALRVRNGLKDVATHGQIESAVVRSEREHALVLERKPRRQLGIARLGALEMRVDDVHSEHAGLWKELGQARCRFSGAATRFEYPRRSRQHVAPQQRDFLRPDGLRLRC